MSRSGETYVSVISAEAGHCYGPKRSSVAGKRTSEWGDPSDQVVLPRRVVATA